MLRHVTLATHRNGPFVVRLLAKPYRTLAISLRGEADMAGIRWRRLATDAAWLLAQPVEIARIMEAWLTLIHHAVLNDLVQDIDGFHQNTHAMIRHQKKRQNMTASIGSAFIGFAF